MTQLVCEMPSGKVVTRVGKSPWLRSGACFPAGTLVRTRDGFVPIEQIQVGDLVLSKPEDGEQAYKSVLKTFMYPTERVIHVLHFPDEDRKRLHPITTTLNHQFWVVGEGWTAAENLKDYWTVERKLELYDGRLSVGHGVANIYKSEVPDVGWMSSHTAYEVEADGHLWDFKNHRLVATGVPALESIRYQEDPDPYLRLTVYNLEVEDFHTYYVGKHGVWVRE